MYNLVHAIIVFVGGMVPGLTGLHLSPSWGHCCVPMCEKLKSQSGSLDPGLGCSKAG